MIIVPKNIVTVDAKDRILKNHFVEIKDGKIVRIAKNDEQFFKKNKNNVYRFENITLIPGFIQTHIHLCQTLFRGLADDLELLDWLQLKIFPFENAHNKNSLLSSVRLGLNELLLSGTTTLLDMGTLRHQEIIFEELQNSGMRAIAGKCLIDENDLFPEFKSTTKSELDEIYQLAKTFHNSSNGKIKYGFAPRFVLSCTEKLLKESFEMKKDFAGSLYHTHSSENKNEIAEVKRRYNKENIEYFNSIGVIDDHSVLAHCVHVNDKETELLKRNNVRVSHCPSSNLKLGSGIANIPKYFKKGISVSLGADGAPCNNNLSIFNEMRLAALIQKPIHGATVMDAKTVFKLATIEGAKALHLQKDIGSIEVGKKADLVLLDLNSNIHSMSESSESIYSNIVYSSSSETVNSVMIEGEWKVLNKKSLLYDQTELNYNSKEELKKLLKRVSK
ncbi:MAG: amidohydrolase family protein [Ignavibacteriaceae bacterium]|nr:amidohydrolase family protein [Ignavibacterium sp.]MCC6254765.1 amidohydrolase family protein [Ignavibacteriaceae bacterium]HRN24990.1 amidohydrolase family protein [Ignavibacteriaceae bacterium]HRQ52630.1 amidohydrolase family protein [Ignavibacteriaceae bacterium]